MGHSWLYCISAIELVEVAAVMDRRRVLKLIITIASQDDAELYHHMIQKISQFDHICCTDSWVHIF